MQAGFARHALHVTKYSDEERYPAGRHVPQNSGQPSQGEQHGLIGTETMLTPTVGLPAWIEANKDASIDNTDIVVWHTFGVTHFPSPEDYPLMPAEPMSMYAIPNHRNVLMVCLQRFCCDHAISSRKIRHLMSLHRFRQGRVIWRREGKGIEGLLEDLLSLIFSASVGLRAIQPGT